MKDQAEFSVQPYVAGVSDGPEIKVMAASALGAAKILLRERLSFSGKFGQLRAYVSYSDDDGRRQRIRCYRSLVE